MYAQLAAAFATLLPVLALAADTTDPYLWLEDVEGEKAIAWVREQNAKSVGELEALPVYQPIYDRALAILDSDDRIPYPVLQGSTVYNFWQDQEHPRGILRRTSLDSYQSATPEWELVLDIDAMAQADEVEWVYKGATCLAPDFRRFMVELSRGGSDATEQREFDTSTKTFVDGGFFMPEAKSGVSWKDANTLRVGTDWGQDSLTTSGYPRIVKEWKRGTPLAIPLDDLLQGRKAFTVLFEPTARVSLDSVATTRDRVLLTTLDEVKSRVYRVAFTDGQLGGRKSHYPASGLPRLQRRAMLRMCFSIPMRTS